MLKRAAVSFDEQDLIRLEMIITDEDEEEALDFLKKRVYQVIISHDKNKLKGHLDRSINPVDEFKSKNYSK